MQDSNDISLVEARLKKANRELTVLNQVNDIIIRANDEHDLYCEICACITGSGGYQLAWICHKPADEAASKLILPLCATGEVAYLKDIKIDLNDPGLSRGPTGTVLNTQETVITNNITSVSTYTPWLEKAQAHGIAASIVLPLELGNGQYGAINIYSEYTNAFDEHEAMILDRVAKNLSLAVRNIRVALERERNKYLLNERVKELTTIHKVNRLLQADHPTESVFADVVHILPSGWQYPAFCAARITIGDQVYRTANYVSSTIKQEVSFSLVDGRNRTIEVVYLPGGPADANDPFLKEEYELLVTIAEIISTYCNKELQHKAIVQSETYLRNSFQYAAIGKAFTSMTGQYFKVNDALCEMLGYTEKELLNMTYAQITIPEDQEQDMTIVSTLVAGHQPYYRTEKRYRHKDGSIVWANLNTTLIRDEAGVPLYFISQIENISERKRAEASLIQSEANLRTIFDNTEVGYLLLDNTYTIIAFNNAYYTGFAAERDLQLTTGANYMDLLPEDRKLIARDHFDSVLTSRQTLAYEMQFRPDAAGNYYRVNVVPVFNNKEILGICISAIDITTSKRLERERQSMIEDLLQKNSDLQQFTYIVSHNIRGPLSTILGLNNIIDDNMSADDLRFYIDGMKRSSENLDTVIRDLHLILQVKKGLTVSKEPTDLGELIDEVVTGIFPTGAAGKMIVNKDLAEVPKISTSRAYLKNICHNLVTNSIKFVTPGQLPELYIRSYYVNGKVAISFTDNGIGIDLHKNGDKIFMLYQRFQTTVEGKGFGLFMAKTQAEALNGSIDVRSEPGKGATFTVYLPA